MKKKTKNNEEKEKLLESLSEIPIVQVALKRTGVAKATFYRWRNEDLEFDKAVKLAQQESVKSVNDLAETQLIKKVKDGNMTAIKYWLEHYHPNYSTRALMASQIEAISSLTSKQKLTIKKALGLLSQYYDQEK